MSVVKTHIRAQSFKVPWEKNPGVSKLLFTPATSLLNFFKNVYLMCICYSREQFHCNLLGLLGSQVTNGLDKRIGEAGKELLRPGDVAVGLGST